MSSSNMSTPAAKRRRVSAANATLRKPFQSPVIRRPAPLAAADLTTPGSGTNSGRTPDTAATSSRPSGGDDVYPVSSPSVPRQLGAMRQTRTAASPLLKLSGTPPPPGPGPARLGGKRKSFGSRAGAVGSCGGEGDDGGGGGNNPFTALVRAHRTTGQDAMIRDVDRQLETVQQASKIEGASERRNPGGPVDQKLRDLVVRWRAASRMAADELFELVRGRVDISGGPRAWRAMQARQMEFYRGLDAEVSARSGSGGGGGEEEEEGGYARDEVESLLEKKQRLEGDGRVKGDEDEDEDEPDFNMAMMLRSLNIDLSLLGYDEAEEKWID